MKLHDKDIREPLFEFLDETYGRNRIIEEKIMGKSRADVVMVTDFALYGFEIKSDADTYARLASQVKDYDKYFDYNYVVVGSSHALHIEEHVPLYWGIITVECTDERFDFYILRRPEPSPGVTWKKKIEILWRPELAALQEMYGMPKYKDKSKKFVADAFLERLENGKIEEGTFRSRVCEILMERDYNNVAQQIKEYKKSELEKKLERENDPQLQMELMAKRLQAKKNFGNRPRRRRRRRTK